MTDHQPVYKNILNQPLAFDQSMQYQTGAGWSGLTRAAHQIHQASQVVLVSIGASYSASIPFVYRLAEAGIRLILEDATEFLHYTYRAYDAQTVFLLISRSGETIEITRALQLLKKYGRFTIGVTNVENSVLASEVDLVLLLHCPSDDLISIQTYIITLSILHLLAELVVGNAPKEQLLGDAENLAGLLQQTVTACQTPSQEWASTIQPYQAIYLLSRGPSLASAKQGALLLHEMSRFPAVAAYSAGQFRHGPWEVADQRIRCFIFAPKDSTYELNIALAEDLSRFGSEVTLVTHQPPENISEYLVVWEIPATLPRLAPLLEIVPVQLFVYEFTRWQDLTPGLFRASTPITLTEGGE